jgi:hypothetical protein
MKAFEPASDEQIFTPSQELPVPYQIGMPCFNSYALIENQEERGTSRSVAGHPDLLPVPMQSRR